MGEYIPFESFDELLDAYEDSTYSIACDSVENKMINRGGIWVRSKNKKLKYFTRLIGSFNDKGVSMVGSFIMIPWYKLFTDYEFLDGTPCGKIKE